MKLKHPDTDIDFKVYPSYFLGGFNVYDQEETLEPYLNDFDPDDENDFKHIFEERFLNTKKVASLTAEHKTEIIRVLKCALDKNDYDFMVYLIDDHDDCFYLPSEWEIESPRAFFEKIYNLICEKWK